MTEIDVRQLRDLGLRARLVDPAIEKDLIAGALAGDEIVAARVRKNAKAFPGKNRTTRIADSVQVRHRGTRVKIQAGGAGAPEAAPIENHGKGGTFRHPVFGHDVWVSQPAHDFMLNSSEESAVEVEAFIGELVDVTLSRLL